jgi:hypothetical protein
MGPTPQFMSRPTLVSFGSLDSSAGQPRVQYVKLPKLKAFGFFPLLSPLCHEDVRWN